MPNKFYLNKDVLKEFDGCWDQTRNYRDGCGFLFPVLSNIISHSYYLIMTGYMCMESYLSIFTKSYCKYLHLPLTSINKHTMLRCWKLHRSPAWAIEVVGKWEKLVAWCKYLSRWVGGARIHGSPFISRLFIHENWKITRAWPI